MSRLVSTGSILLVALSLPASVAAQDGFRLDVVPRFNVIFSPNQLGRLVAIDGGDDNVAFEDIGFFSSIGAIIQLRRGASPWTLRGAVLRSLNADVIAKWECASICPAILPRPAEATVMTATLGIARRLSPADDRLRRFVTLGGGVRRHSLVYWLGQYEMSGFVLHLGAGAELDWRGISFVLGLEDFAGVVHALGEDSGGRPRPGGPPTPRIVGGKHVVHDLSLSLGARIRVF